MAFIDYSTTPSLNTLLGDGTYIGPNMLRNKVRPALQQIAADGKDLADEVEEIRGLAVIEADRAEMAQRAAELAEEGSEAAQLGAIAAITGAGGVIGTVTLEAATRVLLAALDTTLGLSARLTEHARAGTFEWDSSDLSAKVAADTQEAIYVAPASDVTGASGAWVRHIEGPMKAEWFGFIEGDDAGGNAWFNGTVMVEMLATLDALGVNTGLPFATAQGQREVLWGPGTWESDEPLDLTGGSVKHRGHGRGATRLVFYGCTGIRIQHLNTSGAATVDGVSHIGGGSSSVEDMDIQGDFDGVNEAEYHGIHARSAFYATRLNITRFAGDGFYIEASPSLGGNANMSSIKDCRVSKCRNGAYVNGGNANVILFLELDCSDNRQWGIWDSSFLGDTYVSCHMSGNGRVDGVNDGVNIPVSLVSDGVNRYEAIVGQEAWASVNAPSGTTADNQGWAWWKAGDIGGGIPLWFNGIQVRAGGAAHTDDTNSPNEFIGCYTEYDQGYARLGSPTIVRGGLLANWCRQRTGSGLGTAIHDVSANGTQRLAPTVNIQCYDMAIQLGAANGNNDLQVRRITHPTYAPNGFRERFSGGDWYWRYDNTTLSITTGPTTATTFGTGIAQPLRTWISNLCVGDTDNNARLMTGGLAAPVAGDHARGEIVWNRNATVGQPAFWMCVAAGTPGTWAAGPNLV